MDIHLPDFVATVAADDSVAFVFEHSPLSMGHGQARGAAVAAADHNCDNLQQKPREALIHPRPKRLELPIGAVS